MRPADETALVIEVAEAEPLVAEFRAAFDRSAALGAPAHVTLLYPFLHPDAISDEALRELEAFFARRAAFDFELAGVCGFPGVLYLVPDPLPPFDGLTRALADHYPACLPYGGAFADPIPHLTVAQSPPAPSLDEVAARFQARADPALPIRCTAGAVTLLVKRSGRWSRGPRFPLAAGATPERAPVPGLRYLRSPPLANEELNALFRSAWPARAERDFAPILRRSLVWITARDGPRLVGFVNVAWDGGLHGFLLDPTVEPEYRRRGIGSTLLRRAADAARERGLEWLHVDFAPELAPFYRAAGFRETGAGLLRLREAPRSGSVA